MRYNSQSFKKIKCRLCDSQKLKTIYKLQKTPIGDDYVSKKKKVKLYDLKLNMCKECKFVQLSNVINPHKVYGDYLYVTKTSAGLSQHFFHFGNELIKKKIVCKKSKILEIGCNDGTLLKFFKKKCSYLVGVDPASHLFKDGRIKTIKGFFSYALSIKIKAAHGKFDVIIANNVIANIDNLKDIFLGVRNIIAEDGFLIIETFALYGIIKKNLIDNIYHEHLSYFTIETLKNFAQKFDFSLKEVKFLSVKGGSLRFILQKKKIAELRQVRNLIKREKKILMNLTKKFKIIKKINNYNFIKTKNFFDKAILQGKKICGFGASVGTTTLIYNFDLTKKIKYIFDNEKKRFNLYLPGTSIKVLDPKRIKKIDVDYIIIFAWRYFQLIINRNKKLFTDKIKFILPVPRFKIKKNTKN